MHGHGFQAVAARAIRRSLQEFVLCKEPEPKQAKVQGVAVQDRPRMLHQQGTTKKLSTLGMEKDGVSDWCEPRKPAAWQGQHTRDARGNGNKVPGACSDGEGWKPDELQGQCLNLGSPQKGITNAKACRDGCCEMDSGKKHYCGTWQFRDDAGCFYSWGSQICLSFDPSTDLEVYYRKRKIQPGRTYSPPAYSGSFQDLALP